MKKEAEQIAQNFGGAQSTNVATSDLSSINLSSTNGKQNNIDTLFSLCGIDPSPILTPSIKRSWSADEEIGYYISSINTEQQ
ncbi:unnamed protein product, partial [Rotaria sordida]